MYKKFTDIMGKPLYIKTDSITMFGQSADGRTFIAQNGEASGPQIKETLEEVVVILGV